MAATTFTNAFDEKIRPLMDKIDQVRSILPDGVKGITFPSVVVVGDQSSGKSTLLESLSLIELPKGTGIVTRCPLVLRLRKSDVRCVYHIQSDGRKIPINERDVNILQFIEEETKKLAGANKNVVKDSIELQVDDPNVRDLTVIDLPGIARNPIADQPKNIHQQTTDLIKHFISKESTIILCVFPANVDVATVESFTLAREVDPKGVRTIGVITKADLAVNNDDFAKQLLMKTKDVLQLKLGFVAVRNRSVDEKMSLTEAREREIQFFLNHKASAIVGMHCLGIDALISRLSNLYSDRVKEMFPHIRDAIQKELETTRLELLGLPMNLDTSIARLAKFHELSDFYVENVLKYHLECLDDGSLVNKLHIKFLRFQRIIQTINLKLQTPAYEVKVRSAMSSISGEELPNFLSHSLLKKLINEQINCLWQGAESVTKESFAITSKFLQNKNKENINENLLLPKLMPLFRDVVSVYLKDEKKAVSNQLQKLIVLELKHPYTLNPIYMNSINKSKVNENDDGVKEMVKSVLAYWEIVSNRFVDYLALSVLNSCSHSVCTGIRDRLRQIPGHIIDEYLAEDTHIQIRRNELSTYENQLKQAQKIITGYRNDAVTSADGDVMDWELFENDMDNFEKSMI